MHYEINNFQNLLLQWFLIHGRKFPWRNKSASNYNKIISEVLLQRTKAETVAKFYPDFLKLYPSWNKLGDATIDELIHILKPIGLNKQRGERLFKLAQEMKKRQGNFPKQRAEVEEMPMMGQYLTNAYELFIRKKSSPLLDVNMARVLERVYGPRKLKDIRFDRRLQDLAKKVVDHPLAKELNWAILDLASMICKPKNPRCPECPIKGLCLFNINRTLDSN